MALFSRSGGNVERRSGPVLQVANLDVYYGRAHALQGVSLTLESGVTAVVGRNGMGKTTLCNAITGLVRARGSVKLDGREILGLAPNEITRRGIGYVPQGRRTWASLTVDEHLRLVSGGSGGNSGRNGGRNGRTWTPERIYDMFPRLAERKGNGGAQLSGGEQQMLAIGRALLLNPRLLVMDEPTEGLAPVIVEQVVEALRHLTVEGEIAVLLIEQNLGVAIDVADRIAVMMNGRIAREMAAAELGADRELQERLLGVRSQGEEELSPVEAPADPVVEVLTVRRQFGEGVPSVLDTAPRAVRGFTAWNAGDPGAPLRDVSRTPRPTALGAGAAAPAGSGAAEARGPAPSPTTADSARVFDLPVSRSANRAAYIAGTFDTKGRELFFLKQCLDRLGMRTVTVDLSTSGGTTSASVPAM